MIFPVNDERPDNHFLRKYKGLNRDLLNQSEVNIVTFREAFDVIELVRKIKSKYKL